jgi:hypothetical protein
MMIEIAINLEKRENAGQALDKNAGSVVIEHPNWGNTFGAGLLINCYEIRIIS